MVRKTKHKAAPAETPDEKIFRAARDLICESGWSGLALRDVAARAEIQLTTLYEIAPSKGALLRLIMAEADKAIVAKLGEPDPRLNQRDRIFDAMISLFEAMEQNKPLLRVLYHDLRRDPSVWRQAWAGLARTSAWVAEGAGLTQSGLAHMAMKRGIALLLSDATKVWLDDGPDLGKTMAHVDRRLRGIERTFARWPFRLWTQNQASGETDKETGAPGPASENNQTQ